MLYQLRRSLLRAPPGNRYLLGRTPGCLVLRKASRLEGVLVSRTTTTGFEVPLGIKTEAPKGKG